jgi:hypothetical protein
MELRVLKVFRGRVPKEQDNTQVSRSDREI